MRDHDDYKLKEVAPRAPLSQRDSYQARDAWTKSRADELSPLALHKFETDRMAALLRRMQI